MSRDAERPPQKLPAPNEPFIPREVFRGIGALIPEKVAASTMLSMTAKVCYAHLVRRAGKNARCWPSYRDIAKSIGIGERQAVRALKELAKVNLIRPISRADTTGRQTSNKYEFIWGPILQGEGDRYDTLPPDKSDRVGVTNTTPTGLTDMTPLEVTKRNHHQGRSTERRTPRAELAVQVSSAPEPTPAPSQNPESDDDSKSAEYASAKDELKAIYQAKTGTAIRVSDLDAIESTLVGAGVTWETFVGELRGHAWNHVTNPVGFLKHLSKKFRVKTQPASAPVTAAEAKAKNYRCDVCGSRTPGEGARLIDGKSSPCSCATPEYIARQQERGIFAPEEPPR